MSVSDLKSRATTLSPNNYQWLTCFRASTFIYGPFTCAHRLKTELSNVIGQSRPCVQARALVPSSMKSLWVLSLHAADSVSSGASTFGSRRKSVWFEVVCGSPSCGSGGAHSSQRQRASLEEDLRAGCCCLAIREARQLPRQPNSKLVAVITTITGLLEVIEKFGGWNHKLGSTFSSSCLSMTCLNLKWLFQSDRSIYFS